MLIKVVGKNPNVSFDTKDRNGLPLHIEGTSVFSFNLFSPLFALRLHAVRGRHISWVR